MMAEPRPRPDPYIVGRLHQSAIGTLVDRTSRFLRLVHLPAGHMAVTLAAALTAAADRIPAAARLTLTWDQGSEMARHDLLTEHFPEGVYFAKPASPCLRGKNENTNLSGQNIRRRVVGRRAVWRSPTR